MVCQQMSQSRVMLTLKLPEKSRASMSSALSSPMFVSISIYGDDSHTSKQVFIQYTIHSLCFQFFLKENKEVMIVSILSKKSLKFFLVCHVLNNFRSNWLQRALVRSISKEMLLNDRSWSTKTIQTKNMMCNMIVEPRTVVEDMEVLRMIHQLDI